MMIGLEPLEYPSTDQPDFIYATARGDRGTDWVTDAAGIRPGHGGHASDP